jgi:hypothetical protein
MAQVGDIVRWFSSFGTYWGVVERRHKTHVDVVLFAANPQKAILHFDFFEITWFPETR